MIGRFLAHQSSRKISDRNIRRVRSKGSLLEGSNQSISLRILRSLYCAYFVDWQTNAMNKPKVNGGFTVYLILNDSDKYGVWFGSSDSDNVQVYFQEQPQYC